MARPSQNPLDGGLFRSSHRCRRGSLAAASAPEARLSFSPAGDEDDDDVRGVLVEVLAAPVVDSRRARIGAPGSDLYVAERDAGVQTGNWP